ncbi:MAG: adenosine deaminase [Comamonadaceae bacterium CG12_big_fil_rev_8_21_14_0_65_59_15]|nr:MAG: adenosine deaminase [Comamonadaceae bacterium CG12_big_fil_rev_8_21_14_0_65_59_15]
MTTDYPQSVQPRPIGKLTHPAPTLLLCTLGASWAVIAEIFGWLAPGVLDLYAHHPRRAELDALRAAHGLRAPDELWVCSTEGAQTAASLALLDDWWGKLGRPLPLRIWTAAGTDQLATQAECDAMRELTLRVVLLASERCAHGGQLILSLAGGRKTMSADLQGAGAIFGAAAWLHVVGPEPLPAPLAGRDALLKQQQPALFSCALATDLANSIRPLVAGRGTRSELLDVALEDGAGPVTAQRFALPLAAPGTPCRWAAPASQGAAWLDAELRLRQRQGSQLMGNFLAQVAQTEHHDNWRSLYRLPPAQIEHLRRTPVSAEHLDWLTALPKADLHRHLGGCLDIAAQRQVAERIWASIPKQNRLQRLTDIGWLLSEDGASDASDALDDADYDLNDAPDASQDWPWDWPQRLQAQPPQPGDPTGAILRAERCATLLRNASAPQLQRNLYGVTAPRIALKTRHAHGFAAYERPGELSGSALLGHPAALKPYAQAIVVQARAEGLVYLELRGSPHKYRPSDPAGFVYELRAALAAAGADVGKTGQKPMAPGANAAMPRIGFIWILDRRDPATLQKTVLAALAAQALAPDFLLGLDVAGDEAQPLTDALVAAFEPAFAACLPITIHAGEGEDASRIWQAAYRLHADRVGHGLSLADHPQLAARLRDRSVCLELCPSSNREVVGFADPSQPASFGLPTYPLQRLMDLGLPLTLCTDNPGISRTTLAGEYLAAARMTPGGLTQWQALALLRQAFVHAFLPAAQREALLKAVDAAVFAQLIAPAP